MQSNSWRNIQITGERYKVDDIERSNGEKSKRSNTEKIQEKKRRKKKLVTKWKRQYITSRNAKAHMRATKI